MRGSLLAVLLVFFGPANADSLKQPLSAPADLRNPDHVLSALGGKLIGTDRGEWGGALAFQRANGSVEVLLQTRWGGDPDLTNVHGIIENGAGIFVFTGLAHLGLNQGRIYTVARGSDRMIRATLMTELAGAPSVVTKHPDGSTTFLVYLGFKNDRRSYECLVLSGTVVSRSGRCAQPSK